MKDTPEANDFILKALLFWSLIGSSWEYFVRRTCNTAAAVMKYNEIVDYLSHISWSANMIDQVFNALSLLADQLRQ